MTRLSRIFIPLGALVSLAPLVSSGVALLFGILLTLIFGNPYLEQTRKLTHKLLGLAIIGLGAGMNLKVVGQVGLHGIGYTMIGICATLFLGAFLGKFFKTEKETSLLLSVGTAICGGSAIAAVASAIRAKPHAISVALGTVFLLNALALLIFPAIGHALHLSEAQFGLWSALAIHDTSSVVGATLQYGSRALEVGTTVKLVRALWIAPVTFAVGYFYFRNTTATEAKKIKLPWFIPGFLLMAALVTWIPSLKPTGETVAFLAKRLFVGTLFLIGSNMTRTIIRSVGIYPLLQGVLLWFLVSLTTLGAIFLKLI